LIIYFLLFLILFAHPPFAPFYLQNFKRRLSLTLNDEHSPLDASLESVMPGMHQRLVVVERATRQVDEHLKEVGTNLVDVGTKVTEGFKQIFQERQETAEKQIVFHKFMAASLGGVGGLGTSGKFGDSDVLLPGAVETTTRTIPAAQLQHNRSPSFAGPAGASQHRLTIKFHSLRSLYNEWHGLGEMLDLPVPGGIAFLEASNKAKWRRHFSANEKKTFSRVKMVVAAIDTMHERTGRTIDATIDELDIIYAKEAKKSVASMANIIQSMGLVSKMNPRGKSKVGESS
jgi:hypothetical protein